MFLVLGSPRAPREVEVLLDGEPIADDDAGEDVTAGEVTRRRASASTAWSTCREAGDHTLSLRFEPGLSGYAFTFG